MNIVLRKIGNSTGVIIPKETLDRFGLKEGDELNLEARDGGIFLKPTDEEFARQIELGRKFMDRYKVALQKLAE
ncbi:MAG: putative SpoVT/AbrB family transcriptional regulatory protein [Rhizobium sp.]|jgi:putative addiction module antidote|nr:putative SpoVT/AbrB family transcriptional regulatory protein [Rhizobium sp.]